MLPWPTLRFSDWARYIFARTSGQPLLAGFELSQEAQWGEMFRLFWERYEKARGHKLMADGHPWETTVPIMIHGDEGRGKLRRCVMITSVSPVLHSKGHSFLSRYLYSVLPGENYEGDHSLDILQDNLVQDLQDLYESGLPVTCC